MLIMNFINYDSLHQCHIYYNLIEISSLKSILINDLLIDQLMSFMKWDYRGFKEVNKLFRI